MPIITLTRDEWLRSHGFDGRNAVTAWDNPSHLLLPDGAVEEVFRGRGAGLGRYIEPPEAPLHLLNAKVRYQRSLLAREVRDFTRYRNQVRQQAAFHRLNPEACPPAPADAGQVLKAGRAKVRKLREELEALLAEAGDLPQLKGRRAMLEEMLRRDAEKVAASESLAQEIESISL